MSRTKNAKPRTASPKFPSRAYFDLLAQVQHYWPFVEKSDSGEHVAKCRAAFAACRIGEDVTAKQHPTAAQLRKALAELHAMNPVHQLYMLNRWRIDPNPDSRQDLIERAKECEFGLFLSLHGSPNLTATTQAASPAYVIDDSPRNVRVLIRHGTSQHEAMLSLLQILRIILDNWPELLRSIISNNRSN